MDIVHKGLTRDKYICTRRQIFEALKDDWTSGFDKQVEVLEKKITETEGCPFTIPIGEKKFLRNLVIKMKKRWQDSKRMLERFYSNNKEWLEEDVTITNADFKNMDESTPSSSASGSHGSNQRGRRSLDFSSCSERSKRRKVSDLRKSTSPRALVFATQMNLRASGSHAAAKVLQWLEEDVTITNADFKNMDESTPSSSASGSHGSNQRGRRSLDFSSCSERSKRRKVSDLRKSTSPRALVFATQMNLRASGSHAAAKVLQDMTTSPTRASRYQSAFAQSSKPARKEISADVALNLIISGKMTKETYNMVREITNENRDDSVYPSYRKILVAKSRCYPLNSSITITETSAVVSLQALLDHTTARLLQVQSDVITTLGTSFTNNMKLICKWGCDGSSGQQYKQKFDGSNSSDAHVFFTSVVPLQLLASDNESELIVWKNPRPSSPRYCRPLRLQFLKETVQSTVDEKKIVDEQIASLVPFYSVVGGNNVEVKYELAFTMIDGKVRNAITNTASAQRCYLCNLTSKHFNNLQLVEQTECDSSKLNFGISSLHAWIRFMEWMLHIAYKLNDGTGKWQARSADEKKAVSDRKEQIQIKFKEALGLNIDMPKQGFGSTNDGNTDRRFFEDVALTAKILYLDERFIASCKVILQTMSSGFAIHIEKFRVYCLDVAKRYVELYSWYPMPTSIHIVFIHGYAIIEAGALPIGQLSEDAQEARNKDIRRYRESFARKCTREKTMSDVFHRLLASSDPLITNLQKLKIKQSAPLPSDVIELLLPIEANVGNISLPSTETDTSTVDQSEIDYDF